MDKPKDANGICQQGGFYYWMVNGCYVSATKAAWREAGGSAEMPTVLFDERPQELDDYEFVRQLEAQRQNRVNSFISRR